MKEKIFQLLKQGYSHLGLGDEILMLQAETIANLGIVTEDNVESVVNQQKSFLEGLQRANDKRAADAVKKTTDELNKKYEEETKKKAEEEAKRKAEEEARKKAEEELAKKAAEEEAKRKAEEEAEKKKQEELEKQKLPESVKNLIAQQQKEMKEQKDAFEAQIKALTEASQTTKSNYEKQMEEILGSTKALKDNYDALVKEREEQKQAEAKQARSNMILGKAKSLNIPQWRIDEGFVIADDADETAIENYLGNVAKNVNAASLPSQPTNLMHRQNVDVKATKEEMDAVAKSLV